MNFFHEDDRGGIVDEGQTSTSLNFLFVAWFWDCKVLMALATTSDDACLSISSSILIYSRSWFSSTCTKVSAVCWSPSRFWWVHKANVYKYWMIGSSEQNISFIVAAWLVRNKLRATNGSKSMVSIHSWTRGLDTIRHLEAHPVEGKL